MDIPFCKKDYDSNDGMLTSIWGPSMWLVLHTISFNYPVNPTPTDKINYYNYILSLKDILPCKYCRDNIIKNLKKIKFTKKSMKNRDTFSKSIYNLHEEVNKMLGKTSNLSYKQVKATYEHFRARCLNKTIDSNIEKGCVDPLYGIKSKCVLNIVPKTSTKNSMNFSSKCKIKKKK